MTVRPDPDHGTSRPRGLVLAAALAAGLGALSAAAAAVAGEPTKRPEVNNCFWELARGQGSELVCAYPAGLAEQERSEQRRLTRERLQDARCTVSIRIARAVVARALNEPDHVFQAPPQPVVCEITTRTKPFTIEATFAPRVVIKDGIAVDATPGLADVTGVNGYLAWPVVQYINRSATVRGGMLEMINSYLALRLARHG
jgi:hypothetical protein